MRTATEQVVHIKGIIPVFVRMEDRRIRAMVGDLDNLDIVGLLSTSFIFCFILGIFRRELKVVLCHSRLVSISSPFPAECSFVLGYLCFKCTVGPRCQVHWRKLRKGRRIISSLSCILPNWGTAFTQTMLGVIIYGQGLLLLKPIQTLPGEDAREPAKES